jgi:hypothetical protein
MFRFSASFAALALLSQGLAAQTPTWRSYASAADRTRLQNWRTAWVTALQQARGEKGAAAAIAAEGPLFAFDDALTTPLPPVGDYRCRTFKIGGKSPGSLAFVAYPFFTCSIRRDGDVLALTKTGGSQRAVGRLYPEAPRHGIFLGTLVLGDEDRPMTYGRDQARNMAARVERVGEARWRLAFPYPAYESTLDVLELIPAG